MSLGHNVDAIKPREQAASLLPRLRTQAGRKLALLVGLLLSAALGAAAQDAGTAKGPRPAAAPHTAEPSSISPAANPRWGTIFKRRWGVEVLGVQRTAAGHMLEFRYRVLDAKKSQPLFERQTKPVLIHEATGAQLRVPVPAKVGPLRNSNPPLAGRIYWMFFGNPGRLVQPGDRVSVVIGEFRANGIVVN